MEIAGLFLKYKNIINKGKTITLELYASAIVNYLSNVAAFYRITYIDECFFSHLTVS